MPNDPARLIETRQTKRFAAWAQAAEGRARDWRAIAAELRRKAESYERIAESEERYAARWRERSQ